MNVVFEIVKEGHRFLINRYLKEGYSIYLLEPFHAYHHRKGIRFFPPPSTPSFVGDLIHNGKISVLRADEINGKEIYSLSVDKAVEVVGTVYSVYRKRYERLFQYVAETLKSAEAENAFKKQLCNRVAEFYSVNIMLHRIEKILGPDPIFVYPDMNVHSYLYFKTLLSCSGQEIFEHPNIRFFARSQVFGFFENVKRSLTTMTMIFAQTIASGLRSGFACSRRKEKKSYTYGVTIVGQRQLRKNSRGLNFIIDNKRIKAEDVVYFPLMNLNNEQRKMLSKLQGDVYFLPKAGRFFSHYPEWKRLFYLGLRQNFLRNGEELISACITLFNYFKWQKVMEVVTIRHFITHANFGIGHIGCNIALNQSGVQTWYLTDAVNQGASFREDKKCGMRHPFWTYLYYDHLVAYHELLAQYYKEHPGSFKQTHVVGYLWNEDAEKREITRRQIVKLPVTEMKDSFLIAAFDTSYSRNGVGSYLEGIAFAEHLLRLADVFTDIQIFLKEKKDRGIHAISDPVNGPKLVELYYKMNSHPRISIDSSQVDRSTMTDDQKITTGSLEVDASEIIGAADMVISFPFTSTTFESLSVNKPAIWHDPMGYYRNTPYGKIGGVTTHSYEELKAKILEIKKMEPNTYQNPIPLSSPLMDPYRDEKGIDRFRELLTSS